MCTLNVLFNYTKAKNGDRMLIKWMKMTFEIPAKSDRDYKIIGLSWVENKKFWLNEKRTNARWYRLMNYLLCLAFCIVGWQYTFVTFDINFYVFTIVQTFHVIHLRSSSTEVLVQNNSSNSFFVFHRKSSWFLWASLHTVNRFLVL